MSPKEALIYWIKERYKIRGLKLAGEPKPWSEDPVFQTVYFCNVHREDDKVTQWIREFYSPKVGDPMFEYNIIFSRFINWPNTLKRVGYIYDHEPYRLQQQLDSLAGVGKVWGNAYIITTHGMKMGKTEYLAQDVMGQVWRHIDTIRHTARTLPHDEAHLARIARALGIVNGIGSFLAGQIIADLKNTPGHPAQMASDWWTFVVPGPGSIRGLSWWSGTRVTAANFNGFFKECQKYVYDQLYETDIPPLCNQDLQNCLCEFDKYMRVSRGTGRSKRNYDGR